MPPGIVCILSVSNVCDRLLSFLSPKQFLDLRKLCHATHGSVSRYMERVFDIDRRLHRFFPDTQSFRRMQALTSTLISGSFALQYFDRTFYSRSDLDLYVHLHHRRTVGRWVLNAGYTFCPFLDQHEDFERAILRRSPLQPIRYLMPGVADILTFRRRSTVDKSKSLKVQLIVARRTPMEVILGFHSSKPPLSLPIAGRALKTYSQHAL